jgi:hypothetical protein
MNHELGVFTKSDGVSLKYSVYTPTIVPKKTGLLDNVIR